MENIVTITNVKTNILEFNIDVTGIEDNDMEVSFVLKTKEMDFGFSAKRGKKGVWAVTIPELPSLAATMYPFHINVIVDGYSFRPMEGSVNVVGSHELYASKPENITLEPHKKSTVSDIVKKKDTNAHEEVTKPTPAPRANNNTAPEPVKVKDSGKLFQTIAGVDGSLDKKKSKKSVKEIAKTIVAGDRNKKIDGQKEQKAKDLLESIQNSTAYITEDDIKVVITKPIKKKKIIIH